MNDITEYLNTITGELPIIEEVTEEEQKSIPLFLREGYDLQYVKLLDQKFILALEKDKVHRTSEQYNKQSSLLEEKLRLPVIIVLDHLDSNTRTRLINKKVSFIVPGKQLYIPLFADFRKTKSYYINRTNSPFQPASQFLILYHLLVDTVEKKSLKQLGQEIGYTAMTVTRAVNELTEKGICDFVKGKEKLLIFNISKRNLWDESLKYMINPIKRIDFADVIINKDSFKKSSINALAHYTDISDDDRHYFAISEKNYNRLINTNSIKGVNTKEGNYTMEIWKYDPVTFTESEFIDPLNLYLTQINNSDERTELALNNLINELQW